MYKVCCVIAGVLLLLPLWMLGQPNSNSPAETLVAMRDKSRPLLIFYPQESGVVPLDLGLQRQQALLEGHEAELADRDVVVMLVPVPRDGNQADAKAWTDLRREFRVGRRELTVVLVGKDGGEKFRSHEPVTIEKLVALIDAMPMRQQEVRNGHYPK